MANTDDSKYLFQSDHHNGCELAQVQAFSNHVHQISASDVQKRQKKEASVKENATPSVQLSLLFILFQTMMGRKTLFLQTSQSGEHLKMEKWGETF